MGTPNGRLELEGVLGMGAGLWLQCSQAEGSSLAPCSGSQADGE